MSAEKTVKRKLTDFFTHTQPPRKKTIPGRPIFAIPTKTVAPKRSKLISLGKNESSNYILDAGQKELGSKLCRTCGMVYDVSSTIEVRQHEKYHNRLTSFDYFKLTNNSFEVSKKNYTNFNSGKNLVFEVTADDDGNLKEKAITLIEDVVNVDLGFSSDISIWGKEKRCTVWMCVSSEGTPSFNFVSCILITEPVDSAYFVDSEETVSEPNILGINRVWTHPKCRRQGIAKELILSVMKRCDTNRFAFSEPTESGKLLAVSIDGSSNDRYLVYSLTK